MNGSEHFTISMLADEFSLAEMSRITGIETKNREVSIDDQFFEDCIIKLKNYDNQNDDYSDEAIKEKFQRKGKK